jgi:hypothetical protein
MKNQLVLQNKKENILIRCSTQLQIVTLCVYQMETFDHTYIRFINDDLTIFIIK